MERLLDPLQALHMVSPETMATTTAVSDEGKLKSATRISINRAPIDPTEATLVQLFGRFVRWTLPGTLTIPRIIFQTMGIHHYLDTTKMKRKPVIRPGSVLRHATKTERRVDLFN